MKFIIYPKKYDFNPCACSVCPMIDPIHEPK